MSAAPGVATHPQAEPNHLRRCIILWLVLSILGIAVVAAWMQYILPTSASNSEKFANLTIILFTILSVPVAFFVWVFIGYSVAFFRVQGRPVTDGPAIQPRTPAQVGWVVISGLLCIFLFVWGLVGMYQQVSASSSHALQVDVTGQQWTWTFTYPQYGITTHTLELPLNVPVRFKVTSLDVLHGFSIAELGVREDANPGQWISLSLVKPELLGNYTVRCVELCGTYHTFMTAPVRVVSGSSFHSWLVTQGAHI